MPAFRYDLRPHLDSWLQLTAARLQEIQRIIQEELGFRHPPAELVEIHAQLDALCELAEAIAHGALLLAGYHRHHRGDWRRRRDKGQ